MLKAANRQGTVVRQMRTQGRKTMTSGEIAYLSMVMVLFFAFLFIIGFVSQTQDKRREP